MIDQVLRLQFARLHVVESHVEIEIAICDQAIVGDYGNAGLMRHIHRFRHGAAVVRHDHEHVDPPADQRLHVADLARIVAVGGLHKDIRPEFLRAPNEEVAIALPAFLFQRVHGQTDERLGVRLDRFAGSPAPREHKPGHNTDNAGNDYEKDRNFISAEQGEE